jgi:pyruvate formate lyase activating enzyme
MNDRDRDHLLFEIKGNSLDDGPGIRTVIFFKGCPLDCAWCHNPESKSMHREIAYDPKKCIGCGTCMQRCTRKAIAKANPYYIDRSRCTVCCACADACPSGALECVGFTLTEEEVLKKVMADKPFYDNSGGGVTLSGGEPTLHMDYAASLSRILKLNGIHVLLETCGLFGYASFRDQLLPHLDGVYFDLKLFDDDAHRRYCGVSNAVILSNFSLLVRDASVRGVRVLPRIPLIPQITDTKANLHAIASFLKECGVAKADLLPYNPLWRDKCWSLGREGAYGTAGARMRFMSQEDLMQCSSVFRSAGIDICSDAP